MKQIAANGTSLHWREDGDPNGRPVVFANSLGTDLRLWDAVIDILPQHHRYIRFDLRGHGLSDVGQSPYEMSTLVDDAEALVEALDLGAVTFVGLSIGGMIGQGLAARRPDLMNRLVLSNTAARMGTPEMWADRMANIERHGLNGIADGVLDRWFGPAFRARPEVAMWRAMLTRTPQQGYLGCCAAIAGADLTATTQTLTLPVMGIAGSEDGASPADLVRATCDLIAGAHCHVIAGAGHLPCVETPKEFAALLIPFLEDTQNG